MTKPGTVNNHNVNERKYVKAIMVVEREGKEEKNSNHYLLAWVVCANINCNVVRNRCRLPFFFLHRNPVYLIHQP